MPLSWLMAFSADRRHKSPPPAIPRRSMATAVFLSKIFMIVTIGGIIPPGGMECNGAIL